MATTNSTTNYELSQYVGSDVTSYLTNYNSDMTKIDAQMKRNADSAATANDNATIAVSTATTAASNASTALSTANTASSTAGAAQTAAEAAQTAAGAAQTDAAAALRASAANTIENLAPAYDPTLTYNVGDLVTYVDENNSGKLYKCIVAVGTPEAFNINKWDDVTTSEAFEKKTKILARVAGDGIKTRAQIFNELASNIGTIPVESELALIEIGTTGNKYVSHQSNQFTDGRLAFSISTAYLDGSNHVVATTSYRTLSTDLTKCKDFYTEFNNGTYSEGDDSSIVVSVNTEYYLVESDFN